MNTLLDIAGLAALAFVALMVGMQVWIRSRARALRGKPLPPLSGKLGQTLARSPHALVYVFSPSCGACRAITPRMRALAEKGRDVFLVDASRELDVARTLGILATPSTLEVASGQVVGVHIGAVPGTVWARFGG